MSTELPTLRSPSETTQRQVRPVLVFASLGAAVTALCVYIIAAWLLSGPASIDPGPTPVPTYMKVGALLIQTASVIAIPVHAYYVLVRPLRRDGRLGFHGLLSLGCLVVMPLDPIIGYLAPIGNYNSYYVNFGGWANQIPGWGSPNGDRVPQAILFDLALYFVVIPVLCIVGGKVIGAARARWPERSNATLLGGLYVAFLPVCVVSEVLFEWVGIYSYAATGGGPGLFDGTYYHLPLYEPVLMSFTFVGASALCFFRNQEGHSIAERGIDRVAVGAKSQTVLRFSAIVGALIICHMMYTVPVQFFSIRHGEWAPDVLDRSYFTNDMCGPGTDYDCAPPPIPAPESPR